jgi:hypothetical protein
LILNCLLTDDACNQRFTNLSKACTLWLMARDSILTMAQFQGKEDDKLTGKCSQTLPYQF